MIYLLSSCYLILLPNQNQSVYLFLVHIATKFMIKKKTFLNGDLCMCCIMSCSEVFIFQNGINKKGLRQPW